MTTGENPPEERPGFVDTVKGSFNKPEIYRRYANVRLKSVIAMLALLLFILMAFVAARVTFFMSVSADRIAVFYRKNLPEIRVEKGKVQADIPMPYIVEIPEKPGMVVIIDTTGDITSLDDYDRGLLIGSSRLSIKNLRLFNNNKFTQTYDLSEIGDFTVNHDQIRIMQQNIPPILFPALLLIIYGYRVIGTTIQVLIFALLGQAIYKKRRNGKLRFRDASKLAMVAIIPALIITTFFYVVGIYDMTPPILQLIIFYGIYAYYMSFAVNSLDSQVQVVSQGEEKKSPPEEGENTSSVESPEK
jgi:hypothetical protein